MREHMRECPRCERHDLLVRRSLFLVRNLTPIELSPGFRARLDARLREVAALPIDTLHRRRLPLAPLLAAAAVVMAVAVMGAQMGSSPAEPIRLPPVVASTPAFEHAPLATPALVATVPTGMSIWPAIMAASRVPVHYVATEMADER